MVDLDRPALSTFLFAPTREKMLARAKIACAHVCLIVFSCRECVVVLFFFFFLIKVFALCRGVSFSFPPFVAKIEVRTTGIIRTRGRLGTRPRWIHCDESRNNRSVPVPRVNTLSRPCTHPLCVRLILSAMRGAISMVPILPSVASTLAVWSIELVT
jgi:hypothetical protein